MQYRDKSGNLSEGFFAIGHYICGYGLVRKEKDGPYQYRDKNGNLSEEFAEAYNYYRDYAVVRKEKNGPYQYRDKEGNLSKPILGKYRKGRIISEDEKEIDPETAFKNTKNKEKDKTPKPKTPSTPKPKTPSTPKTPKSPVVEEDSQLKLIGECAGYRLSIRNTDGKYQIFNPVGKQSEVIEGTIEIKKETSGMKTIKYFTLNGKKFDPSSLDFYDANELDPNTGKRKTVTAGTPHNPKPSEGTDKKQPEPKTETSDSYYYKRSFLSGYSIVKKTEHSDWQFLNPDGKLSKETFSGNIYCVNGHCYIDNKLINPEDLSYGPVKSAEPKTTDPKKTEPKTKDSSDTRKYPFEMELGGGYKVRQESEDSKLHFIDKDGNMSLPLNPNKIKINPDGSCLNVDRGTLIDPTKINYYPPENSGYKTPPHKKDTTDPHKEGTTKGGMDDKTHTGDAGGVAEPDNYDEEDTFKVDDFKFKIDLKKGYHLVKWKKTGKWHVINPIGRLSYPIQGDDIHCIQKNLFIDGIETDYVRWLYFPKSTFTNNRVL